MAEQTDPNSEKVLPPPIGPFVTAALSTFISSVLLVVLKVGPRLTMVYVLSVVIPAMTIATTLVAVSMGWIFVSIGRSKRQPRWVLGSGILIAVTMLALLVATYMTEGQS
jgi:hypothetical protein